MPKVFEGEVSLEQRDGVALITLAGLEGKFPWGTGRAEHRWNPVTVSALGAALDEVEKSDAEAVVVANAGKYWSNGMDLNYLDAHGGSPEASALGLRVNELLAKVCTFPLPTVAALGGHWCAAGGMMGLAFDYRVMASDRGFFFVPGVDLGLVYAPMQVALMKAKLPQDMHREVIVFNSKRWTGDELAARGVVESSVPAEEVTARALELAAGLRPKGQGAARKVLGSIKAAVYKEVLDELAAGEDMNYGGRTRGVDRAAPPAVEVSKL
jgi:enoyl-CoA hydratase/carnithine racemase